MYSCFKASVHAAWDLYVHCGFFNVGFHVHIYAYMHTQTVKPPGRSKSGHPKPQLHTWVWVRESRCLTIGSYQYCIIVRESSA